jgi:hypothetical protein
MGTGGAFSFWVKRQGREDDHSPPTSAARLHGVVLS